MLFCLQNAISVFVFVFMSFDASGYGGCFRHNILYDKNDSTWYDEDDDSDSSNQAHGHDVLLIGVQ